MSPSSKVIFLSAAVLLGSSCGKKDSDKKPEAAPTPELGFTLVANPTLSLDAPKKSIQGVAYSSDGSMIAVGGEDGFIRLYDQKGNVIRDLQGHSNSVRAVAFTPDNKSLVSASFDKTARLWDVNTGNELKRYETSGPVEGIAISKEGKRLLTGQTDGYLKMWDIDAGSEILSIEMPTSIYFSDRRESVYSVAFLPDGQSAVSGNSHSVHLWDLNSGKEIRQFHSGDEDYAYGAIFLVESVAVSEDGSRVVAASRMGDGFIFVWETQTGKQLSLIHHYGGSIYKDEFDKFGDWIWLRPVMLSPDGSKVIAGVQYAVRVWNIGTGKEVYRFQTQDGDADLVNGLALSPDLSTIARVGTSGSVQVWTVGDLFTKAK